MSASASPESEWLMIRFIDVSMHEARGPAACGEARGLPCCNVDNARIVERLRGRADALAADIAAPYRAAAYRRAADIVAAEPRRLHDILAEEGTAGLDALPGVGPAIAGVIRTMLMSDAPFSAVPGHAAPPVQLVLEVDREFREKAAAGRLPTHCAAAHPRSSAVPHRAPVLEVRRGGWHFRALYSTTARAHDLGRSRDWVVIHYTDGLRAQGRHTVVTESRGAAAGRRVVRGRESACRSHYVRATRRDAAAAASQAR
jgi:hypothetical protein